MFDFPASPSVGQTYTLNGVTYRWNGYAWVQATQPGIISQYPAHGGVILELVDAANVRLRPCNGNRLIINGQSRELGAPIIIPKSLVGSSGTPHLYAKWNGSAIEIEPSGTHHATHTDGVEIMSGDPSRTYVGCASLYSNTDFRDDPAARLVASWFNRRPKDVLGAAAGVAVTSTARVPIGTAGWFVSFKDEVVTGICHGTSSVSVATTFCTGVAFDNAPAGIESVGSAPNAGYYIPAGGYAYLAPTTTAVHSILVTGRNAGSGTITVSAHAVAELRT